MTIAEMIQVLQAAERGEEIQLRHRLSLDWQDVVNPRHYTAMDFSTNEYRVKPKPRLVPLEPSDVPPGSVFKREVWSKVEWFSVLRLNETGIEFATRGFVTWTKLMDWLISRDGGRTWSRAEKEAK